MDCLIAYSTTKGSTAECARLILQRLEGNAELADLKKREINPEPYNKIILGSSIYAGSIQKEMKNFCTKYEKILLTKQLGVYLTCLSEDEYVLQEYLEKNFSKKIAAHLSAFGGLGGAFYFSKINFFERKMDALILRNIAKSKGISMPSDGKTDYITFSAEKIDRFCQRMSHEG